MEMQRSTSASGAEIEILFSSLEREDHRNAVVDLINEYRTDPMGGPLLPLTRDEAGRMIGLLHHHPACRVFLAACDRLFIGLLVSFVAVSTFQARPLLNVHDLIVKDQFRRRGVGKRLLDTAGEFARSRGYCRLTLEVRNDNSEAQRLYSSVGFAPCSPPMEFWHRELQ